MPKDLLSIGAFAGLTRLSIQALRLYDQLGILLGPFSVRRAEQAVLRATRFLEEENITIVSKTWTIMPGADSNETKGIHFILRVVAEPQSLPGSQKAFPVTAATPPSTQSRLPGS